MLLQLNFKATFASTGKSIQGDHHFNGGLTAITGPNESGKSFRLEMIRYGLWGVAALRDKVSTFTDLNVTLVWKIGEDVYKVARTKSAAKLYRNDHTIVTGVSPVNVEIKKLFGYDMEVFDVANACLQGQVEALSNMKPTERKQMVDQVIGLNVIDDMITELTKEMSSSRGVIDGLSRRLHPDPKKPEPPFAGYVQSATEYQLIVDKLHVESKERAGLEATLLSLNCDMPDAPCRTEMSTLEGLMALRDLYVTAKTSLAFEEAKLSTLKGFEPVELPADFKTLDRYLEHRVPEQWDDYREYCANSRRIHETLMSLPSKAYLENLLVMQKILPTVEQIRKLEVHQMQCPNCQHEFPVAKEQIDKLKSEIPPLFDVEFFEPLLRKYGGDPQQGIDTWEDYEDFKALAVMKEPTTPYYGSREEVTKLLEKAEAYTKAKFELETQTLKVEQIKKALYDLNGEGIEARIKLRHMEDQEDRDFEFKKAQYLKFKDFADANKQRIAELKNVDNDLEDAKSKLKAAQDYETAMMSYMLECDHNEEVNKNIKEAQASLDEMTAVRKSLQDLKPRVKLHLVPSLNRVASNLMSLMTGGERNLIQVDEDFNIVVDGQPVDTLSGSAKSCANLAIRIGLGTVLTSKVFSVLLADEVDAAMDKDRAAFTAQCLRGLTATFSQIVLVSHQKPEADHQIQL